MKYGHFSRITLLMAAGVFVFAVSGCGQSSDDELSTSSIDSTLAWGDFPDEGLTPEEEYNPPAPPPAPAPAPVRKASPPPAPKAPPKPAPPATLTVPDGTQLSMSLATPLTTKTAMVGDRFSATLAHSIIIGNRVAIPAGAMVHGHVAATQQPGKMSGRGMMQLAYDELEFDGRRYQMATVGDTIWGEGGSEKDVAMIAGGAAAGAILGKLFGGSAGKGALLGGAAGTAASLATRGPQLELVEGEPVAVRLETPVEVTVPDLEG